MFIPYMIFLFFHKALRAPLHRLPPIYKYKTSDILVEREARPHGYKAEAPVHAQQIAQHNRYKPLHSDAHVELEVDIARGPQCLSSPDVYGSPYL